jgi:hypothetical protein
LLLKDEQAGEDEDDTPRAPKLDESLQPGGSPMVSDPSAPLSSGAARTDQKGRIKQDNDALSASANDHQVPLSSDVLPPVCRLSTYLNPTLYPSRAPPQNSPLLPLPHHCLPHLLPLHHTMTPLPSTSAPITQDHTSGCNHNNSDAFKCHGEASYPTRPLPTATTTAPRSEVQLPSCRHTRRSGCHAYI